MKWFLSKYLIAAYLSAIFAAGAVSGWVVAEHKPKAVPVTPPRPDEMSKFYKHRVHEKLNLTDDQKLQVDAVIDKSSGEIQSIYGTNMKAIRQALTTRSARIKGLLTPEQQQAFARMEKEKFEPWHGPGPWKGRDPRWDGKNPWQNRGGRPNPKEGARNKNDTDSLTNNAAKEPAPETPDSQPEPKAN